MRKVLCIAEAHMSQVSLWGPAASTAMGVGVLLMSFLQAGVWARVYTPARHYFSTNITTTTDWHQGFNAVCFSGPQWVGALLVSVKH